MNIERAFTQSKNDIEHYSDLVSKRIQVIEQKGLTVFEQTLEKYSLGSFMKNTLSNYNEYSVLDKPDNSVQLQLLKYWQILAKAFYKLAFNPDKEVEVIFRDTPVSHKGKAYTAYMGFNSWLESWSVFFVLRDRSGIELMISAPNEVFERADIKWDKLDYNLLEIFRNIYNTDADMVQLLINAMESTGPDSGHYTANKQAVNYVLYIYEPLIRVYDALLRRDESDFNTQLQDALELHKKYWGTEKDNKNNDSRGWISWYLLAPVAMAYDFGMKLEVTSDYIPEWLVKEEFYKIS